MSFSISKFLGFSDDDILASYYEMKQISIIDGEISLDSQSEQVSEIAAAR